MYRLLRILLIGFLLIQCSRPVPSIENIDLKKWKEDRNACSSYRSSVAHEIQSQKEKLLALDEKQIVGLLGKPDRNELYKRNQKFYYYYITPSPDCAVTGSRSSRLAIRFNAMGLAKEVVVE